MRTLSLLICFLLSGISWAQGGSFTFQKLPDTHPRYLTGGNGKSETLKLIEEEAWAQNVLDKLKQRTDIYANRGPEWLTSRLQMYWKTHATEVYIKGEYYDHAGGERAPAPTVMYTGARSHATNYARPKLEDLKPYQESAQGMSLVNKTLDGINYEWVNIAKTGNIIQSINVEILGIARDAAFLWWITEEQKYAELAASVFDTYMTGIYYRNVPKDLNHGHQQTLVGMTSFEVIHEDALNALVPLYDFLYDYLRANKPDKMNIYAGAFKKWADNIIDNGVPHNNWNLMQARFVMSIGMILEDDAFYPDKKGRGYYIDYVLNRSSIRQWSLKRLADYGYDTETGIWAECPGYSQVVIGDYTDMVTIFDRNLGLDLTEEIPVIKKAVAANPQYLFPDRMTMGFGDTHPGKLNAVLFARMVANAQKNGKKEQERQFTALLKLFQPEAAKPSGEKKNVGIAVNSFFSDKPLVIDDKIPAADINDYVTPTFYAPNASWLVQRNGMNRRHSLMIAQNASEGNHMHANGISMELYGKGYRLAPDAGIGVSLYSGLDYLEYYSQFPAHNTVCVDGISSYPVMKSNHAFRLLNCYPTPGEKVDYQPVSYSEVYFREPESQADQNRMMSIVTTGAKTGYYVDIFRSRKVEGGDKMHDYFYHNMGQQMNLAAADGTDLNLQPTEELAFAGAHIYAYSYIFDKKSAETSKDIKSTFTMQMPDRDNISMTLWMKGEKNRKVFSALSPMTEGLSRLPDMPYNIKEQPTLTYVARQEGEAWNSPFVAVYEPSSVNEPGYISSVTFPEVQSESDGSHVGICIQQKDGRTDRILSSDNAGHICKTGEMTTQATYALWGNKNGNDCTFFLGGGTLLQTPNVEIKSLSPADILLEYKEGTWFYSASMPCEVTLNGEKYVLSPSRVLHQLF